MNRFRRVPFLPVVSFAFVAMLATPALAQDPLANTQVRLNYIFRTIDNLFVVYNETRFTEDAFDGRVNRSLVLKATYSVHR